MNNASMDLESLSLADFQKFRPLRPDLAQFSDFVLVDTYEEFLSVLYQCLYECIKVIEEDPGVRLKDDEDRLTTDFKTFLIGKGYQATHDEKIGGHCDLIVRQPLKDYVWLCEAKIHKNDYVYLKKGFNQLCTRYSPGTQNYNQCGFLIYIRQPNASEVMIKWKKRLIDCNLNDYSHKDCDTRNDLAFISTHCHESSGLPITVRHLAVVLHFNPQDR